MEQGAKTALGTARERFIDGLSRRAQQFDAVLATLIQEPESGAARQDLQRQLHGLLASAQLFEQHALSEVLQRVTARVDVVMRGTGSFTREDMGALQAVLVQLSGAAHAQAGQALERASHSGVHALPETGPHGDKPVEVSQTVSGLLPALQPPRVLCVCARPTALRLRELVEHEPWQLAHASDADQAIRMLHAFAPSSVLIDAELANQPGLELARRLRTDPLSKVSGVYVLLPEGASYDAEFLRQTGSDGVLIEPFTLGEWNELLTPRPRAALPVGPGQVEGTVDDIAGYVAEEIRRGIADSLRAGHHERIQLGDARELMAAAWSAVGRVRSHLAEQSRGRVRFRDEASADKPRFLGPETAPAEAAELESLAGARIVVADDDPAVLWFFCGLLREAGAQVLQAQNGREALLLARGKQPHVVLSDILMPKIDGFALCREFKRDALLCHVPVILLSWKDDFLERMRELDAGASGYVRKEAGSREILGAVASALRPRRRLAQALASAGEVTGRIEGLGVLPLLETAASERADVRVVVHDAWNMFEIDVRNARQLSVTRTAADGSFARGDAALLQLLGVNTGRFSVIEDNGPLRNQLEQPLRDALLSSGKRLCALLDAVSDTRLMHVALLAFEEDVVEFLLGCTPTPLHEVVTCFRSAGAAAKDLLLHGRFTPAELEGHLRELARRGAISGVWSAQGDDLVALARKEREEQPGNLLHSSNPPVSLATWFSSQRRSKPPPVGDNVASEAQAEDAIAPAAVSLQPVAASVPEPSPAEPSSVLIIESVVVGNQPQTVERAPDATRSEHPAFVRDEALAADGGEDSALANATAAPATDRNDGSNSAPLLELSESESAADDATPTPVSLASDSPVRAAELAALDELLPEPVETPAPALVDAREALDSDSAVPNPNAPEGSILPARDANPAGDPTLERSTAAQRVADMPNPAAGVEVGSVPQPSPASAVNPAATAPERTADSAAVSSTAPAPRRRNETVESVQLMFTLAALVALGYFGWQRIEPHTRVTTSHHAAEQAREKASARTLQPTAASPPQPSAALETAWSSGTDPSLTLGRILPYIDESRGVQVSPDQGLLVLELTGSTPAPEVRVGGRELGKPPLAVAVPAGRQELVLHQGRDSSFRYLIVRPGETRIVTLPLPIP